MTDRSRVAVPIACVPQAIPADRRGQHFALANRLFKETAISRTAMKEGYSFVFPVDALGALAEFVGYERLCCPFMRFELEVQPGAEVLALRMIGPPGTREVLDAELLTEQCISSGCNCHDD